MGRSGWGGRHVGQTLLGVFTSTRWQPRPHHPPSSYFPTVTASRSSIPLTASPKHCFSSFKPPSSILQRPTASHSSFPHSRHQLANLQPFPSPTPSPRPPELHSPSLSPSWRTTTMISMPSSSMPATLARSTPCIRGCGPIPPSWS